MYFMVATRLKIAFAMGVVSCIMPNSSKKHWEVEKCIPKPLKCTSNGCLCFGDNVAFVIGYTNVNYRRNVYSMRSLFGHVFITAGGAISWRSSFQDCTFIPTPKASYVGVVDAIKEALWLVHLIQDLYIIVLTAFCFIVLVRVLLHWKRISCFMPKQNTLMWGITNLCGMSW